MIRGKAGTGKTILSMQWLFEGWEKFGDPGIYVAATEPFEKAIQNISSMSFFNQEAVEKGDIRVTDLRSIMDTLGFELSDKDDMDRKDVDSLVETIEELVIDLGAKRLVIDSITAAGLRFDDKGLFRDLI
ncbi:MAG: ATPase domain-containing protein [Candidatus Hadarchaeota archaeon]